MEDSEEVSLELEWEEWENIERALTLLLPEAENMEHVSSEEQDSWRDSHRKLMRAMDEKLGPREMSDEEKAWLQAAPMMAAEAMAAVQDDESETE